MTLDAHDPEVPAMGDDAKLSRRSLVGAIGAGALGIGAAALGGRPAMAQTQTTVRPTPPTTISNPPRDFGPQGAPTTYFSDPDILSVDPSFDAYVQPNSAIQRLWTGALWAEGPAWNAQGRYLVCDHFAGPGGMKNDQLYMTIEEQRVALQDAGFARVEPLLLKRGLMLYAAS